MSFCHKVNKVVKKVPGWAIGFGMGMFCLMLGGLGGQFAEFYRKAVMICLECIGIG